MHLAVGSLGILRQIRDSDECARFCLHRQLDSTKTVLLSNGSLVRCTYVQTWPRPADPASCSFDRVEPDHEGWKEPDDHEGWNLKEPDHEADNVYDRPNREHPTNTTTVLEAADAGTGETTLQGRPQRTTDMMGRVRGILRMPHVLCLRL